MNKQQAFAEAKQRWATEAGIEDVGEKYASTPEARAAAKEAYQKLDVELKAKEVARDKLLKKVARLAPSREKLERRVVWNLFYDETRSMKKDRSEQANLSRRFRYKVGSVNNMCGFGMFSVMGEGDTWEAAFKKADDDKARFCREGGKP